MLALVPLVHPSTVTTVDHPHRPQSSTANTSSRPVRPSQRKLHSAIIIPGTSQSSSSHIGTHASGSTPSGLGSSHRVVSQPSPSVIPSTNGQRHEDDDPHTPPPSDSEGNGPMQVSTIDVNKLEPENLLRMLATALKRIAELNAGTPTETCSPPSNPPGHPEHHSPIWWKLTSASRLALSTTTALAFHARNVPTIALDGYLSRIHKYCPASNEVFVSLMVYLDRMTRLAKEGSASAFPINMYNLHRLIIAGVTVASKFFSDVFYTNSRYAKVGGLPLQELNQLELRFLLLNDFSLTISIEEMDYYITMIDLQYKIPEGVDLSPFLPPPSPSLSSRYPGSRPPVGPREFFAAVDAYFGQHHEIARPRFPRQFSADDSDDLSQPYASSSRFGHSTRSYSISSSDAASEAGTETDVDCSTDDEPTIRPPHSSASSETMSLRSEDADSIYTNDGDMSRDDDTDEARPSEGTPGREYMIVCTP